MDEQKIRDKLQRYSKVSTEKSYNDVPCREWQRSCNEQGYGFTSATIDGEFKQWMAHRLSLYLHAWYDLTLHVLHKCDNPSCIEPYHLTAGTVSDNMRDMISKNRQNYAIGTRAGSNKLTEDQVREIRHLLDTKQNTRKEIESLYGIKKSTVQRIAARTTWTWLGD